MKSTKVIIFVSILITLMFLGGMIGNGCAQKTPTPISSPSPTVAKTPTSSPTAKKAPTDSLVVALGALGEETFLPWNGGSFRHPYMLEIYEPLVNIDPKTEQLIPCLAAKWEMSSDGMRWTFWLQKGVQFQEGWGEFTSADVKYSITRYLEPSSLGSGAGAMRPFLDRIETPDPYQVVFYMTRPAPGFINYLNPQDPAAPMTCKKYIETVGDEKANAHPIGTGPYTLAEEHKKAGSFKLTTVPGVENHWRITPEFKNITLLIVPEEAARTAMLKSGEIDLAAVSYDSIDSVKASGLHIVSIPGNWNSFCSFGGVIMENPKRWVPANPWAKKEVRQALNYAIDKEAICKSIFKSEAVPAASSGGSPAWNNISPYPYDPAKAKQLLAAAGFPNGFTITMKGTAQAPGAEIPLIMQAIAMNWKAIGIDVKLEPTDWAIIMKEWKDIANNNYVLCTRNPYASDSIKWVDLDYNPDSIWCYYETPETAALYKKCSMELDINKREQLVHELGIFLRDEAACVYVLAANEAWGASKKVGNWQSLRNLPSNFGSITHP
jgi:peptide/nickel transport system substrate-binding protein